MSPNCAGTCPYTVRPGDTLWMIARRFHTTADQIAAFLGDINPYWSAQEWRRLLYDHLAMTKTGAVDLLTQKYADSDMIFDNIEREALEMADLLTRGIISRFHQSFR